MKIVIGADHAGVDLKQFLLEGLRHGNHEVLDVGTYGKEPVDYPDIAIAVGAALGRGDVERGILVCGSGVGVAIAANKLPGIRAGLCHDTYSAHQGVEHDDANVLALGARVIGPELAQEIVNAFLGATFSGEERHQRRVAMVRELDQRDVLVKGPSGGN